MKFRIIGSIVLVLIVITAYACRLQMAENSGTGAQEPTSGFVP